MHASSLLKRYVYYFYNTHIIYSLISIQNSVGIADETFPLTVYDFLVGVFVVLGGIITAAVVLPFILLCVVPLLWAFIMLRKTFVSTR